MNPRGFSQDNRAVAPVIAFILLLGILVLLLAIYQAQIVPQQNAETELEHHQETRDELRSLHNAISAVGVDQEPRFESINLGTSYESRTLGVNPPPPAGTIRTEEHNITIANESGNTTDIPTQFIEYQPGYNELEAGSTWYENSVLYFDGRDRGNSVSIIEDQEITQGSNRSIISIKNEFQNTRTGRVTLELYPPNNKIDSSLPEPDGNYTVKMPTRLNGTGYWEDQLGEDQIVDPVEQENYDLLNFTVKPQNLDIQFIGINSEVDEKSKTDETKDDPFKVPIYPTISAEGSDIEDFENMQDDDGNVASFAGESPGESFDVEIITGDVPAREYTLMVDVSKISGAGQGVTVTVEDEDGNNLIVPEDQDKNIDSEGLFTFKLKNFEGSMTVRYEGFNPGTVMEVNYQRLE